MNPAAGADFNTAYYLLQALLSLLVVVGLIYLAYYLLRRMQGAGLNLRQEGPARLVQSVPLAAGNVLHVVQIENKTVLLTAGPGGVTVVDEMTPLAEGEKDEG